MDRPDSCLPVQSCHEIRFTGNITGLYFTFQKRIMSQPANHPEFLRQVTQHQGILHRICRLYREQHEDREDLFQEMIYQLWKAWPSYKGTARISTWMYRIALNTALASFRTPKPSMKLVGEYPEIAAEPVSSHQEEKQAVLLDALRQLNDGEKAIISLYLEELSYPEIAGILGISESNVGVKLHRIKNKLQQLIQA